MNFLYFFQAKTNTFDYSDPQLVWFYVFTFIITYTEELLQSVLCILF